MVSTLTLILAGVVLYTLVAMTLRMQGYLPGFVRIQGPITTLHTQRGKDFLDWLAGPKRFWRAWGNFGIGVALVVLVGSFLLVAFAAYQAVTGQVEPSPLNEPRNVLAIPGVNQFLPLTAAGPIIAGLLVGLVVHEGGHGLMCRVEDIDIDSMGLAALAFIPIGAFVEPDEESREQADRGAQTRMFSAGVMNNFAITVVAFALLFGPVAGSIAVVSGVPVGGSLPGSPADRADIGRGDVIVAVGGQEVSSESELNAALAEIDDPSVRVTLRDGRTVVVERTVIVTSAAQGAPVDVNTTITAVNGTPVDTREAFLAAVQNRTVATLSTSAGNVTTPIGAYTIVLPEQPDRLAPFATDTPLEPGTRVVVTSIAGERVATSSDLGRVLDGLEPGQRVQVVGYVDGERRVFTVTLAGSQRGGRGAFLGVGVQRGVTGFTVDDFGIDTYPARAFLGIIGGGDASDSVLSDSPIQRAYLALTLPFASVSIPGVQYNFAGFVGPVANFYTAADGPLAFLGTTLVFILANVLFWTAWINLIIGQFNCIPSYPLDGGHILRTSTEAVVSRVPLVPTGDRYALVRTVTLSVSVAMIAGVLLMIFGPRLFS